MVLKLDTFPKNLLHICFYNLFQGKIEFQIQPFPMQLSNIHKKIFCLVLEVYNL
jgi:hypothetical protein